MEPNEFKYPRLLLNNIKRAISGAPHAPVFGVRAHASWTRTELAATPCGIVWLFFRRSDGRAVAKRIGGGKLSQRDEVTVPNGTAAVSEP